MYRAISNTIRAGQSRNKDGSRTEQDRIKDGSTPDQRRINAGSTPDQHCLGFGIARRQAARDPYGGRLKQKINSVARCVKAKTRIKKQVLVRVIALTLARFASVDFLFAEREGFEPPEAHTSTVFKTAAIDHSAISPYAYFFPK